MTPPPTAFAPPVYRPCAGPHADPLWSEWVLANGLGGYAMGTAAGVPTRRYHGLLVAAVRPPVDRITALTAVVDRLTLNPAAPNAKTITLTPFHFRGARERPLIPEIPFQFEKSAGTCRWTFDIAGGTIEKTLTLADAQPRATIAYRVKGINTPWQLDLRPLVALRDFHALCQQADVAGRYSTRPIENGVRVATRAAQLSIQSENATVTPAAEVWRALEYIWEERRGMDCVESVYCPAIFSISGQGDGDATLDATMGDPVDEPIAAAHARRLDRLSAMQAAATTGLKNTSQDDRAAIQALAVSADDFVVRRGTGEDRFSTIVAGYPWFSDWGRDTMIALPGLLLATGRHEEAFGALRVFGRNRRRGLIPNRFDDYAGAAHYNTVDAPIWFLHAAAQYREASGDDAGYQRDLAPACLDIIDAYTRGTDFDIAMDANDALIAAGNPDTQLTWMDAQRDGVTFTPRFGKCVEINALWGHGLAVTADAIAKHDQARAEQFRALAARVRASFNNLFPDPATGGLFDRLEETYEGEHRVWKPVHELRPNQIFAASLAHSPLDPARRAGVVACVRTHLLTPHGLRTLAPGSDHYVGRLQGSMFDRDAAYHNGTVWPWLIGHYVEALLRSGGSPAKARAALNPLIETLAAPYPGTIAEIYDGDHEPDHPQRPDGCIAQAWSVAETLRALRLVATGSA